MAPAEMINFGSRRRFLLRQLPLPKSGKLQQVLQLSPHLDDLGADPGELILDVAAQGRLTVPFHECKAVGPESFARVLCPQGGFFVEAFLAQRKG